jgi:hypothetical protein
LEQVLSKKFSLILKFLPGATNDLLFLLFIFSKERDTKEAAKGDDFNRSY